MSENAVNLITPKRDEMNGEAPAYFYQRFGPTGECFNPNWPRITTLESAKAFHPRKKGLRVLLINAPIREWSWPNIMPIGQGYVGAVAAMDGHQVDVLDLNAERKRPVKDAPAKILRNGSKPKFVASSSLRNRMSSVSGGSLLNTGGSKSSPGSVSRSIRTSQLFSAGALRLPCRNSCWRVFRSMPWCRRKVRSHSRSCCIG